MHSLYYILLTNEDLTENKWQLTCKCSLADPNVTGCKFHNPLGFSGGNNRQRQMDANSGTDVSLFRRIANKLFPNVSWTDFWTKQEKQSLCSRP
jgi:hypothetical protein